MSPSNGLLVYLKQWCSLVFCSEYTVIFFPVPASYAPVPEQPLISTTLTKQGSTLAFIFRSTCAADKKKFNEHLLLNNKISLPITK